MFATNLVAWAIAVWLSRESSCVATEDSKSALAPVVVLRFPSLADTAHLPDIFPGEDSSAPIISLLIGVVWNYVASNPQ